MALDPCEFWTRLPGLNLSAPSNAGTLKVNKPDLDNIIKFVQDSLKPEGDQMIHTIVANKIWGEEGKIILRQHEKTTTDSSTNTGSI